MQSRLLFIEKSLSYKPLRARQSQLEACVFELKAKSHCRMHNVEMGSASDTCNVIPQRTRAPSVSVVSIVEGGLEI